MTRALALQPGDRTPEQPKKAPEGHLSGISSDLVAITFSDWLTGSSTPVRPLYHLCLYKVLAFCFKSSVYLANCL